jgi:hypothetical protein
VALVSGVSSCLANAPHVASLEKARLIIGGIGWGWLRLFSCLGIAVGVYVLQHTAAGCVEPRPSQQGRGYAQARGGGKGGDKKGARRRDARRAACGQTQSGTVWRAGRLCAFFPQDPTGGPTKNRGASSRTQLRYRGTQHSAGLATGIQNSKEAGKVLGRPGVAQESKKWVRACARAHTHGGRNCPKRAHSGMHGTDVECEL